MIPELLLNRVTNEVCARYGVTLKDIRRWTRDEKISTAKNELCYLLYKSGRYSYQKIADHIWREDHTTIIHAIKKYEALLKQHETSNSHFHNSRWLQQQ